MVLQRVSSNYCSIWQKPVVNSGVGCPACQARTLVLRERAGSKALKGRFDRQLVALKSKRLNLSERVKGRDKVTDQEKEKFYSTYLYGAVHVLTSIPTLQTRQALAVALGVSPAKIADIIDFLLRINVLKETNGKYSPGSQHIHLDSNSSHIVRHHLNWRLKTMERIGEKLEKDLHYSVVFSLSQNDADKIKETLLKALEEISGVVTASPEETAYVYCFDFFELGNH